MKMNPTETNLLAWVLRHQPTYITEMEQSCPLPRGQIRRLRDQLVEKGKLVPYNDWENRQANEPKYLVVAGSNAPDPEEVEKIHVDDREHCETCGSFLDDDGICSKCQTKGWFVHIGIEGYDHGDFVNGPYETEGEAQTAAYTLFETPTIEWIEITEGAV